MTEDRRVNFCVVKGFIFALDYNGLHIESGEKKPSRLPSAAFNIPAEHKFYVALSPYIHT